MTAQRTHERWLYAAKPASWGKLLVPTVFGQVLGAALAGRFTLGLGLLGLAFAVLDLLFIVYLNDWGDREVDTIKRRMFPHGCSKKTIPDGILRAEQLLFAGVFAGFAALLVAFIGGWVSDRLWFGPLGLLSLGAFCCYTFPPIALNYRGGGELVEGLGIGVLLPLLQAYLQAGHFDSRWIPVLVGNFFLALSSALASALADEESDRAGGKHTVVTALGNYIARRALEACLIIAVLVWSFAVPLSGTAYWVALPPALAVGIGFFWVRAASDPARTSAFAAIAEYKRRLHRTIASGSLLFGALAWIAAL